MTEGMLSKSTLLLLIYEIIKLNNEILRKNEFELSSDVSDDENVVKESTEKRLPYGMDETEAEQGASPQEQSNINGGPHDRLNGDVLGDGDASANAHKPSGTSKNGPTYPSQSVKEKKISNILSGKLKGMGKDIGRKLIERVLIYKNDFSDLKDIAKLIGRDVWIILFNKNVDKIQSYKKGVYVLTDNDIGSYLNHLLLDNDTNQKSNFTHYVLVLILGIIKGILNRFRMKGSVTYTLDYPTCSFQINIIDD